jgi:hypothetical protein
MVEDGKLRLQLLDGEEDVVLADRRVAQDVGADDENVLRRVSVEKVIEDRETPGCDRSGDPPDEEDGDAPLAVAEVDGRAEELLSQNGAVEGEVVGRRASRWSAHCEKTGE